MGMGELLIGMALLMGSPSADSQNVSLVGYWPVGEARTVALAPNQQRAFLNITRGVLVLDISDQPRALTRFPLPYDDEVRTLFFEEALNRLYIGIENRVQVWDVSDPETPQFLGSCSLQDSVMEIYAHGNRAYVANRYQGLRILDVSDPSSPTEIGSLGFPGACVSLSPFGNYLVVATQMHQLRVVDISDPENPQEVGNCNLSGMLLAVTVQGQYAYVAAAATGGLHIVDLSDPSQPTRVSGVLLPGVPWDVVVEGSYAYVANLTRGLDVVDVSDPTNPEMVYHQDLSHYGWNVEVHEHRLYIVDHPGALCIFDITHPENPQEIGAYYNLYLPPVHLYASLSTLCASGTGGLHVFDLTQPSDPGEIGVYAPTPWPYVVLAAWLSGDLIYALTGSILRIFSFPGSSEIGQYHAPTYLEDLWVSDSLVFLAAEKLRVVDVSNPSSPQEIGTCDLPVRARQVEVAGSYAYLANSQAGGLYIVDVSTPSQPQWVGSYPVRGRLAVANGYVFVAEYDTNRLLVLDVTDPLSPQPAGSLVTSGYPLDVAVAGSYAYVTTSPGGLRVIDVSDPHHPSEVGFYVLPANMPLVVFATDSLIFASQRTGLGIYRNLLLSVGEASEEGGSPSVPHLAYRSGRLWFTWYRKEPGRLFLYNVAGRLVDQTHRDLNRGINSWTVPLAPGVYFLHFRTPTTRTTAKVWVVR